MPQTKPPPYYVGSHRAVSRRRHNVQPPASVAKRNAAVLLHIAPARRNSGYAINRPGKAAISAGETAAVTSPASNVATPARGIQARRPPAMPNGMRCCRAPASTRRLPGEEQAKSCGIWRRCCSSFVRLLKIRR